MSKNIDIKLQIESINVARKELKKHFGKLYELGALSNSIPLLEELEKLREGRKEIPIATITIDNQVLQKMVDEKVKDIELDIQGIRNKAIDDFADNIREIIETSMIPRANELETIQALEELMSYSICRIAEQLKEGGV